MSALSDRYEIRPQPIASGAMGEIFAGRRTGGGPAVVVKRTRSVIGERRPTAESRLRREGEALAQLNHPHVVRLFDLIVGDDGRSSLVMEHVQGHTLHDCLNDEGAFPAARGIFLAVQLARALRHVHRHGMIHRDVKPANIMLTHDGAKPEDERLVLIDFGLVKMAGTPAHGEDSTLTIPGCVMGSPQYMSPEQVSGDTTDHRTDIYAFGVTLFEMFAGRPPFEGRGHLDVMAKHLGTPAPDLSPGLGLPKALRRLVRRCLAKAPDDRYASFDIILMELARAFAEISTTEDASEDPTLRPMRPADDTADTVLLQGPPKPRRSSWRCTWKRNPWRQKTAA